MEIVQYPNEILVQKMPVDKPVDKSQIDAMVSLMFGQGNCQGISANQVGIRSRFFIMREGLTQVRYCHEPEITGHGRQLEMLVEGCMSLGYGDRNRGGIFMRVPRWRVITAEYTDERGKRITTTLKGLQARIFQHEMDHLNGLMIIKTEPVDELV